MDLDGDGAKEAVAAIFMPGGGPQGSDYGTLYFYGYDKRCTLHVIATVSGGVGAGTARARSYVYPETQYATSPGGAANLPTGYVNVEVRIVNGKLKEMSRVAPPQ